MSLILICQKKWIFIFRDYQELVKMEKSVSSYFIIGRVTTFVNRNSQRHMLFELKKWLSETNQNIPLFLKELYNNGCTICGATSHHARECNFHSNSRKLDRYN